MIIRFVIFGVLLSVLVLLSLHYFGLVFLPYLSLKFWALFWSGFFFVLLLFFYRNKELVSLLENKQEQNLTSIDKLLLVGIFILATILSLRGLSNLQTGYDATFHFEAVYDILNGQFPQYTRAVLYSFILALFQFVFGNSLQVMVLPGLIFNLLTIGVVFIFAKEFLNKQIALMAIFLLAISPWQISQAQTVRMYSLFQLFFILFVFVVYYLINNLFIDLDKKKTTYDLLASLFFLIILFMIAAHLQLLVLSVIPVLGLFILGVIIWLVATKWQERKCFLLNKINIIALLAIISIGFGSYFLYPYVSGWLYYSDKPLLPDPANYMDFFLNRYHPILAILLLGLVLAYTFFCVKINKKIFFFLFFLQVAFYGSLIQFIKLYDHYFAPRFVFHLNPIFILLLSIGVWLFVYQLIKSKRWTLPILLIILLVISLLVITNFKQEQEWLKQGRYSEDTIYPYDIRYPFKEVIGNLSDEIKEDDFLLATQPGFFLFFQNKSKNIFDIDNLRTSLAGELIENDYKVMKEFFKLIKIGSHGYFLSDYYRMEYWPCETLRACFMRTFIKDNFIQRTDVQEKSLLVYEWFTIMPTRLEFDDFRGTVVGDYLKFNLSDNKLRLMPLSHLIYLNQKNNSGSLLVVESVSSRSFIYLPSEVEAGNVYEYELGEASDSIIFSIVDERGAQLVKIRTIPEIKIH